MTARSRLAAFVFASAALAFAGVAPAVADDAGSVDRPYLDIPITQSVNRDGVLRYAVWVKVGERSVQALLDTGSTGLRVLPTVLPDVTSGVTTDMAFGTGFHMQGPVVKAPVEIGSLKGTALVEVVTHIGCSANRPDCDPATVGADGYLIGGEGYPSQGYSAILGIGLPFIGTDIGNPLQALGAKRWIVDLPRPFEASDGHLILDPDAATAKGFTMLDRNGIADADGCIQGGALHEPTCGTVLFDTGAPTMSVSIDGVETTTIWEDGTHGTLTFPSEPAVKIEFQAGKDDGVIGVRVTPPKQRDQPEAFIMAGLHPYLKYDMLYDAASHTVGLRARAPMPAPAPPPDAVASTTASGPDR